MRKAIGLLLNYQDASNRQELVAQWHAQMFGNMGLDGSEDLVDVEITIGEETRKFDIISFLEMLGFDTLGEIKNE